MIIDCEVCPVRGAACDVCVMNVLFVAAPPLAPHAAATVVSSAARPKVDPDNPRKQALRRLSDAGVIRPLWAGPEGESGPKTQVG